MPLIRCGNPHREARLTSRRRGGACPKDEPRQRGDAAGAIAAGGDRSVPESLPHAGPRLSSRSSGRFWWMAGRSAVPRP